MSDSTRNFENNIISSRSNKTARHLYKLIRDSKYRRDCGEFVAEGARLCEDAASSHVSVSAVFFTEKAKVTYKAQLDKALKKAENSYLISDDVSAYISDTKSPQGIFCVCRLIKTLDITDSCDKINKSTFLKNSKKAGIIALENIQDPTNLGTILRTAEALGLPEIWLSHDCCDLYNPKVIRGSMGAIFRLSIRILSDFPAKLLTFKQDGIRLFACVAQEAEPITALSEVEGVFVCVIGNEGAGLTRAAVESCSDTITIPMLGKADSLNAAMAAGIVMWEMMREQ